MAIISFTLTKDDHGNARAASEIDEIQPGDTLEISAPPKKKVQVDLTNGAVVLTSQTSFPPTSMKITVQDDTFVVSFPDAGGGGGPITNGGH